MTGPVDLASFALLILGLAAFVVLEIGRKVARLRPISYFLVGTLWTLFPSNRTSEPVIITPYGGIEEGEINAIVSNTIGVLTTVGATYGVLFALVVSEKAALTFSSWAFVIWCGWVLAILLRICNCGAILLSDYHRWDRKRKEGTLYGIAKFSKHSAYLLIPTASFIPLFATMKTVSLDQIVAIYPWGQDISLFSGVVSIAIVAVFFYAFVLAFGRLTKFEYADIYMYTILLLWGIGLVSISLSPLAPVTNKILGLFLFEATVPSVVAAIEIGLFLVVGLSTALLVITNIFAGVFWKLYKTIRNRHV